MAILTIGSGGTYALPSLALAAATEGDTLRFVSSETFDDRIDMVGAGKAVLVDCLAGCHPTVSNAATPLTCQYHASYPTTVAGGGAGHPITFVCTTSDVAVVVTAFHFTATDAVFHMTQAGGGAETNPIFDATAYQPYLTLTRCAILGNPYRFCAPPSGVMRELTLTDCDITIQENFLHGAGTPNITGAVTITRCQITSGHMFQTALLAPATSITRSTFIYLGTGLSQGFMWLQNASILVANNVFVSYSTWIGISVLHIGSLTPRTLRVAGNIFRIGGGYAVNCYLPDSAEHDHNVVWNTGTGGAFKDDTLGTGDVLADPLLVDETPGSEDLRIHSASPCLDACPDLGYWPDIDGKAAATAGGADIGAFEVQVPAVVSYACPSTPYESFVTFDSTLTIDTAFHLPSNWVITSADGGVPCTCSQIQPDMTGTEAHLYHSKMTGGKSYTITVSSNVSDSNGNSIDSFANSASFSPAPLRQPDSYSATFIDSTHVEFRFSEAMIGTDLTDPTKWTVVPLSGGATVTIGTITHAVADRVILTVSPGFTGDSLYRATCPDTITDASLNVINSALRTAAFMAPKTTATAEPESGNPWAVTADGSQVNDPGFEFIPWDPTAPVLSLPDAVWISLFSDRRASDDDTLPDTASDPTNRGGWWADSYASGGDQFGSKLWLLVRDPINSTTILKVQQYAAEALAWMTKTGMAARIDVAAERQGTDRINLLVSIYKQDGKTESINFPDLWAQFAQAA